MFSSASGVFPSASSLPPDEPLDVPPSSLAADASPASPVAVHDWLAQLKGEEAWVASDRPEHHAAFLVDIGLCLQAMGIYPAGMSPLVSWVFFDRWEESQALVAPDPDVDSTVPSRPWLCGYFAYDGSARIGIGEVKYVRDQAHPDALEEAYPVMHESWPLRASQVFKLAAEASRSCHQLCRQPAPDCCDNGNALRAGLVRYLRCQPALAERLARQHPLASGFKPPPLSEDTLASNSRARQSKLGKGALARDYKLPINVLGVLVWNPGLRETALQCKNLEHVALALGANPTALRTSFHTERKGMPPTLLAAQGLHPEWVQPVSDAPRARMSEELSEQADTAIKMFQRGEDLADALARGILRSKAVKGTEWTPTGSDGGV